MFSLNREQNRAVKNISKNSLILAGAGAGKTRCLVSLYLKQKGKVSVDQIVAITFTKKASQEMIQRIESQLTDDEKNKVVVKTIHSYAYNLIKTKSTLLIEPEDTVDILQQISKPHKLPNKIAKKIPTIYDSVTDRYYPKSLKQVLKLLSIDLPDSNFIKTIHSILQEYQDFKQKYNYIDFSDIIRKGYEYLKSPNGVVLLSNLKCILVDEAQDINSLQYLFLQQLNSVANKMVMFGDDWQSIYGFRGGDVECILDFSKSATVHKLCTNYRSNRSIISLCNQIMSNQPGQIEKNMKGHRLSRKGKKPSIHCFSTYTKQTEFILSYITGKTITGTSIAILARNHSQLENIKHIFDEHKVTYLYENNTKKAKNKHIGRLFKAILIIIEYDSRLHWATVLNQYRGVGTKTIQGLVNNVSEPMKILIEKSSSKLKEFMIDYHCITNLYHTKQYRELILRINEIIMRLTKESLDEETTEHIIKLMMEHHTLGEMLNDFHLNGSKTNSTEGIFLGTIHSSKGLEWDEVIIIGCESKSMPKFRHNLSLAEILIQSKEERRIFYVGCSRAKTKLMLCSIGPHLSHFIPSRTLYHTIESSDTSESSESSTEPEEDWSSVLNKILKTEGIGRYIDTLEQFHSHSPPTRQYPKHCIRTNQQSVLSEWYHKLVHHMITHKCGDSELSWSNKAKMFNFTSETIETIKTNVAKEIKEILKLISKTSNPKLISHQPVIAFRHHETVMEWSPDYIIDKNIILEIKCSPRQTIGPKTMLMCCLPISFLEHSTDCLTNYKRRYIIYNPISGEIVVTSI